MSTPYLDLVKLGVEEFIFHSIRAFCPQPSALLKLQELCNRGHGEEADGFWTHKLHARPMFEDDQWKSPQEGFAPTLTVGTSTASLAFRATNNEPPILARLLRQGVGIVTTVEETKEEAILVEPKPVQKASRNKNKKGPDRVLGKFASKVGIGTKQLVMPRKDEEGAELMLEDTSYEVTEIVFKTRRDLLRLTDYGCKDDDIQRLRNAVAYFLARSYDVDAGYDKASRSLGRVVEELRCEAIFPLVKQVNEVLELKNLSQSVRGFVALGPRGAVLAHAKHFAHLSLRVSALNMIEILRGRHFNMIVARTVADNTIRDLSKLADLGQSGNRNEAADTDTEIRHILNKMMIANYLYGLVVSDPGAYLLDGSTLTRLTDEADKWMNLGSLREDTERKMTALYRLWQHFQDSQRIDIIHQLVGSASPPRSRKVQSSDAKVGASTPKPP